MWLIPFLLLSLFDGLTIRTIRILPPCDALTHPAHGRVLPEKHVSWVPKWVASMSRPAFAVPRHGWLGGSLLADMASAKAAACPAGLHAAAMGLQAGDTGVRA